MLPAGWTQGESVHEHGVSTPQMEGHTLVTWGHIWLAVWATSNVEVDVTSHQG